MWGRYLEIGVVWCGLVLRCSPRLIMSGLANGCLGFVQGRIAHRQNPPSKLSSRLWTGMVSGYLNEWITGWNFKTFCPAQDNWFMSKNKTATPRKTKKTFFLAEALFSISDPFNTTAGFCFFYHLLHVCRLCVPLPVTWLLLTSAPRSPRFLFKVSWTGWRTWLRASQVAGLGPGKAKELICSYLHISQVEVMEGAIWFQLHSHCFVLLKNNIAL